MIKEIHLVGQHDPQETRNEHYCRRWPGISILEEEVGPNERKFITQISKFENHGHRYFEIAMAKTTPDGRKESITLGIEMDENTHAKISFLEDARVPRKEVGQTCEKCALFDCRERVAAPVVLHRQRKLKEIQTAIDSLR